MSSMNISNPSASASVFLSMQYSAFIATDIRGENYDSLFPTDGRAEPRMSEIHVDRDTFHLSQRKKLASPVNAHTSASDRRSYFFSCGSVSWPVEAGLLMGRFNRKPSSKESPAGDRRAAVGFTLLKRAFDRVLVERVDDQRRVPRIDLPILGFDFRLRVRDLFNACDYFQSGSP